MHKNIGFMQGRLSPMIGDKIQAFPWNHWREEFAIAERYDFSLLEWTLDHKDIYDNPLLTAEGQAEIRALSNRHGVSIRSLTGDCFMQAPFWKCNDDMLMELRTEFRAIVRACAMVGISFMVIPLVDNGAIETKDQENKLIEFLHREEPYLIENNVSVLFESDFNAEELLGFIKHFNSRCFGINYDIGNSASYGFDPLMEIDTYGTYIKNVHVKDRTLGGNTVPLGHGNADFSKVFSALSAHRYSGNFILQTARADRGQDTAQLVKYRDMTAHWLSDNGFES